MLASPLPVRILAGDDARRPLRRIGRRLRALGVAIAAERIDHRPRHRDAAHARVLRRRSGRQRDRRVARIVRPHRHQHGEMAAARLARTGRSSSGRVLRLLRVRLGPAHRVVDVLHRGRIRRLVAGAEIERDRHDAVPRHRLVAQLLGHPVAHAPGAAVALDQRRERPLAFRPVDARQQRLVAVAEVFDVLDVERKFVAVLVGEQRGGHGNLATAEGRARRYLRSAARDGKASLTSA